MRRITSLLLLVCCLTLLGSAESAKAQDILTFKVDPSGGGICCWSFTVQNGSSQTINKVQLSFTDINPLIFLGFDFPENWDAMSENGDKLLVYSGLPIAPGATKAGFSFCHDGIDSIDKPIRISWKTFNNETMLSQGTVTFICTPYQTYSRLDSVSIASTKVGTDPIYTFTVHNRNEPLKSPIGRMIFELATPTAGMFRPSSVVAPANWTLDSVTASRVYFRALQGAIYPNTSQGGFQIGLRSNTTVKNTTWVWRALDESGTLVDRDTVRNIPNNADNGAPSCDEVAFTNPNGCIYNMAVSNYHATNAFLPSKITQVRVISRTSGVTFQAAPTKPKDWSAVIKAGTADTLFFTSAAEVVAIPSGLTYSDFAFSVNNPSGTAFDLEWQTLRGTAIMCSTVVSQQCSVEPPREDEATIQNQQGQNCSYQLTVTNAHNTPPSALRAISVEVPQGAGTLEAQGSDIGWEAVAGTGNRSFLFRQVDGSSDPLATGASTTITFKLTPANPDNPVQLNWATYETAGSQAISNGSHSVSCAPIPEDCETVTTELVNAENCGNRFTITNVVEGDITVNSVTITPKTAGITIRNAGNQTGWQKTIAQDNSSVTYTGSLPSGISLPFMTSFMSDLEGERSFSVDVVTINSNNRTCTETVTLTCTFVNSTESVDPKLQSQMKLTLAPNPTHGATTIRYHLPSPSRVSISVLDILGNTQKSVFSNTIGEGNHELSIDASTLANGMYYVRIETEYGIITRQLVINH